MNTRSYQVVLAIALVFLSAGAGCESRLPLRTALLFDHYEKECLEKGWQKLVMEVNGQERQVLWRGPHSPWAKGAIVAMHGGGGTFSNFGAGIPLGEPMVEFGNMAVEAGFAVFSPDSAWDLATDPEGRGYGKRWDCVAVDHRDNVDIAFLERVVTDAIPSVRPRGSSGCVFMTGISNGGFMTILAAAHFPDKLDAFASVSAGDPYGTVVDLATKPGFERPTAPGVFRDRETGKLTSDLGAALAPSYPNEAPWPALPPRQLPPFKLFHHQGDALIDTSCMEKARAQLIAHGYPDAGPFVIQDQTGRTVWKHFWNSEYNQPLIDFFSQYCR